jgi:hypothetical protein
LGGQELQCEDIAEEWDLCTPALVQSTDGLTGRWKKNKKNN